MVSLIFFFFFFFQAEDGIRDGHVTGVQTYALPISCARFATSTAAGRRSGRERKAHTPLGGTGETLGKGQTFGARGGLTFGSCRDLSFEVRPRSVQPRAFPKPR